MGDDAFLYPERVNNISPRLEIDVEHSLSLRDLLLADLCGRGGFGGI